MNAKLIGYIAVAAALAAGITAALTLNTGAKSTPSTTPVADTGMQKCYGIARAAKNDCGAIKHPCQGQAKIDNDPYSWVYLPAGTCSKIVNGTTKAPKL